MQQPQHDKCSHCDRPGLSLENPQTRRKCRFCYKENPGENDRSLYIVVYCSCDGGKISLNGMAPGLTPFFSLEEAEEYIREKRKKTPDGQWRQTTLDGKTGWADWRWGGFYYIQTALIQDGKQS